MASSPLWDVHVTIAFIAAVASISTAWLSNRNHAVLKRIDGATNGSGDEKRRGADRAA